MPDRRVVITGIGPVTPVGTGVEEFWQALTSGRSGVRRIQNFDASDLAVQLAGEVPDFEPSRWMDAKETRRTDRVTHFSLAGAQLAWEDAGKPEIQADRGGIIMATGIGGIETLLQQHSVLLEKGPGRVSPFMVPALMANASAGHIAMRLGLTGPNLCTVTACASGAHAVGEGFRMIRDGMIELAVVGGSEAATLPLTVSAFAQMQALTKNPDPETASRPFDAERDGFVLSEGSCVLVLEESSRAAARGARVYAEVAGYGASADAFHITAPDPKGSGAAQAIKRALADAGVEPEGVQYVNAHGTSTQLNDASETRALKSALGEEVAHSVPVSSTKSMTGHMLGAAGAVEAAVLALTIQRGVIPPTIHYRTPDPDCDLDPVPNEARETKVDFAISNSFGFGGQNAVVAVRRAS
ncbi:MAG: beta-ketoacyl-ACP synthase II [Actinomycetota bacterium]|nr:beta-ketoacyl-ACP synthase II [Actinomycetota bacterium]